MIRGIPTPTATAQAATVPVLSGITFGGAKMFTSSFGKSDLLIIVIGLLVWLAIWIPLCLFVWN
jgi:ABC-type transport system involved in multi-copper enzyme maturation permease subunit